MLTEALRSDIAFDLNRDSWELMNLIPRDTGLPLTVWVGPRGGAKHDVRVKVCMTPGDRMIYDNVAIVSVRPTPELLHGELSSADLAAVRRWIELNRAHLIDYWNGDLSTLEFAAALTRI
jgi:hypothetical protein